MPTGFAPQEREVPNVVTGQRGPADSRQAISIKPDVAEKVVLVRPTAAPFMVLANKLRETKPSTQWQYNWLTKDEMPRTVRVLGAQTIADTAIEFVPGHGLRIPTMGLLKNRRTREVILVTAQAVADTVTAVRAMGGVNANAMDDGDELEVLATAHEDGAAHQLERSVVETAEFNFNQIVRTGISFTGRQMNTDFFSGSDVASERAWAAIEHSKSLEKTAFFGVRSTRAGANGKLQTTCGGLEYFIKTNILDLGGNAPSLRTIDEWLEWAMRLGKGGNEDGNATKMLFHSGRWGTTWDWFGKDRIQTVSEEKVFGLSVRKYISTHGTLLLTKSPSLEGGEQSGYAFLVDLNHVSLRPHQGRNTKLYKNRQNPDVDGEMDEYITDFGLQVEAEYAHGLIKGLPL
jgi:hypothetical protein